MGSKLKPEVMLISKVEGGGNPVVSLLKSDNFMSTDVVDMVKFTCGVSSERSTSNSCFSHLNDICSGVPDSR